MNPVHTQEIAEYAKALSKAQAEMPAAEKDSVNPFFKSKFASYESIVKAIRSHLTSNGFCWTHVTDTVGAILYVKTFLIHESGQYFCASIPVETKGLNPQEIGKAITYAKRYGLVALTGCRVGDDDDGEQAMRVHRGEPKPPKPPNHKLEDLHAKLPDVDMSDLKDYVKVMALKISSEESYVINQAMLFPDRIEKIRKTIVGSKLKGEEKID